MTAAATNLYKQNLSQPCTKYYSLTSVYKCLCVWECCCFSNAQCGQTVCVRSNTCTKPSVCSDRTAATYRQFDKAKQACVRGSHWWSLAGCGQCPRRISESNPFTHTSLLSVCGPIMQLAFSPTCEGSPGLQSFGICSGWIEARSLPAWWGGGGDRTSTCVHTPPLKVWEMSLRRHSSDFCVKS